MDRTVKTLDELGDELVKSINERLKDNHVLVLGWLVEFEALASNTHCRPLNGKTNWGGRDKDAPRGYPGFSGRVWVAYKTRPEAFSSESFLGSSCHPGAGGAGKYSPGPLDKLEDGYPTSYDFKFFVEDFPGIEKAIKNAQVIEALKGKKFKLSHRYRYDKH